MNGGTERVGPSAPTTADGGRLPASLTRLVWLAWLASLVALGARWTIGWRAEIPGVVVVDGLTVLMWSVVTFFSGIVHSYSRRYMAGDRHERAFFVRLGVFTIAVCTLVAADHVGVFLAAWLGMGVVMADLVGTVREWDQAQAARRYALRSFVAGGGLLGVAFLALWRATGQTTISGILAAEPTGQPLWLVAAGGLTLAAMIQSALVPFHGWLLASITAPTPASALMHAGFVNAGGVLLVRFAPVVAADERLLAVLVAVGATAALGGKLLKSVQPAVKARLGCSTTGQMGFMIVQVGLGFFGAAIAHLVLHGCYKASLFLGAGGQIERTLPAGEDSAGETGAVGWAVTAAAAVAGGALFAALTGKGTAIDSGLVLTGLVVLTTLHATRTVVRRRSLSPVVRYGAVVAVFLPAVAAYAGVYLAVTSLLGGVVTAPVTFGPIHAAAGTAFGLAYLAVETDAHRSTRLYVWLVNAGQPPIDTVGGDG